jgi:hypothetical protein
MTQFERTGNPFPGLRPFETEEYNLFFGREGQSDELLARLGRTRFLAVVGASGSGKSSLIRAGLMPALYGGLMGGTGSGWRIAVMRPGHDPIGNLACALSADDVLGSPDVDDAVEATIIETTLRRSTLGLVDAARQARLPEYENVLVVVDQFEELFRFRSMRDQQGTDDDAAAFVKLLLEAPRQRDAPIYVVLTMRSDFLGDCSQFQGLPEAINDSQYLIPRMTRDERRSAITGPAAVGGGEISQPLVNRLLNDVGDNPDQLPILQHALMRTWDYWSEHRRDSAEPVGLQHYEAVGAMSHALSLHADEAWDELPDERSRHVAESLFKALTERGVDNRDIRRPTRLSEICEITGATLEEVAVVVEVFRREGRSFLMPPVGVALTGSTVLDISHESLIRNWARLKEWVRDEAEAARIYRRLAGAAADYHAGEGGLLDDVTLGWVLKWRDRYSPNRAWGVRYHTEFDTAIAYLEESRMALGAAAIERERQRQELLDRERREREQAEAFAAAQSRAARRLRWLMAALLVVLLFAITTAGFAIAQRGKALENADAARRNEQAALKEKEATAAALKQMQVAEEARKAARAGELEAQAAEEKALKNALDQKKRADDEASRAEQQAAQALVAKKEAERRALALTANGKFRDATILAERGEFPDAAAMYEATIKGLQENGVKDTEGVADTYVQLGQTHFGAMQGTSLNESENYNHVTQAVESYDQAVEHYKEAAVNAKAASSLHAKAADTLLSVGATLLKIANDVPVGRNVNRASEELAALSLPNDLAMSGGVIYFDEGNDPKVKLKNQALERYKSAFLLYRKAGNEDGMMQAAYRIGNFYLRDELPAWQDTTPTLDIALCKGPRQEYIGNRQKALCYFKELERLSLAHGKKDADIQRLLVWIGGLHFDLGEPAAGESYVNRAQQAYLHTLSEQHGPDAASGRGWAESAEAAEAATLSYTALLLYDRALKVYEKAGDYSGQALMHFKMGDLKRRSGADKSGASATQSALAQFKDAVESYKQNLKAGNVNDGHDWRNEFFAIGSFADDNYDEELTLDAYNVALALGEARRDELMQARAWSGIASVQTQHDAGAARQSYMRSFALYSKMREEMSATYNAPMPEGDEYLKELERISAAVLSLDKEIKANALAGNHGQGADSLCPFPVIAYAEQATATEGDTIIFSAYNVYPDTSKLNYEWTLSSSSATIVEHTLKPYPAIRVSTNGVGKGDLTVTLVVSDGAGANACRQTAHATTKVAARPRIPIS